MVKKTYKKKEHWGEDEINCLNSKRSDLLGTRIVPVYSVGHLQQELVDPAHEELMVNSRMQANSAAPPSFVVHSNSVEFAFQQNICVTKKKICGCRRRNRWNSDENHLENQVSRSKGSCHQREWPITY